MTAKSTVISEVTPCSLVQKVLNSRIKYPSFIVNVSIILSLILDPVVPILSSVVYCLLKHLIIVYFVHVERMDTYSCRMFVRFGIFAIVSLKT